MRGMLSNVANTKSPLFSYALLYLAYTALCYAGKEEGKKHGLGRTGGVFVGNAGGQFVTATPIVGCEPGYLLAGDRCERLEYAPGTLTCPKHAKMVGDTCLTAERISSAQLCPPGTRSVDGGCEMVETMVPVVECSKGWEMTADGKSCERIHTGKGKQVCRDGWTLKRGICSRSESVPARPSCPAGYLLQGSNGKKHAECVLNEIAAPEVFCAKGWIAEGGACIHIKKKPREAAACPPGFAPGHKGTCERRVTQDQIVTCPPGTTLVSGGKKGHSPKCAALEHRPVVPSCKKGFEFINNRCQKASKGELAVECPKGYELMPDGGCFVQTEVEAISECAPGATLSGKHCITPEERPLDITCPKGSSFVGGTCVSHEMVAPRMICPDGFKKGKKHEDVCILEQVVMAEPNCPLNSHLSGKHCIVRNVEMAEVFCKKGDLTPEGCVEEEKKEPKHTCPRGYKKHKGTCSREVSLPPAYICPQGSILQERNQCLATTLSESRFSCPPEFVLDGNNNCLLDQAIEPVLACPINTVLTNGQCYKAAFMGTEGKKKHKEHF